MTDLDALLARVDDRPVTDSDGSLIHDLAAALREAQQECMALAASQCPYGLSDSWGNIHCNKIAELERELREYQLAIDALKEGTR